VLAATVGMRFQPRGPGSLDIAAVFISASTSVSILLAAMERQMTVRSPFAFLPVALVAFILLVGVSRAEATPIVSVSSTTVNIADVVDFVTVDISIADAVDLYAYQFGISFDPAILGLFDIVDGDFLSNVGPTVFISGAVGATPGLIEFTSASLLGPGAGASGTGLLFSVLFDVKTAGVSPVSVVFEPLNGDALFDSELLEMTEAITSPGSITIEPRQAPEPMTVLLVLVGGVGLATRRARSLR